MEAFRQEAVMLCVNEIHDRYASCSWDFCDAVRELTPPGILLAHVARQYSLVWGFIPDGYTIEIFNQIDREKENKQ